MVNLRLHDEFDRKTQAKLLAMDLRRQGVQFVRVRKSGKKYQVLIGGRGSQSF